MEHGKLSEKEAQLSHALESRIEKQRITLDDFAGKSFAGSDVLLEDGKKVAERRRKIRTDREKTFTENPEKVYAQDRGRLSELANIYGLKSGSWAGENTDIIIASDFDDYFNGVDCILELDDMHQVAIGIDTTISRSQIVEKIKNIRDRMLDGKEGKLTTVKYFKSKDTRATLENVPLTVIGVDSATNAELAELIYDMEMLDEQHSPNEIAEAKNKLKKHGAQFKFLFEIEMQLGAFGKFAAAHGKMEIAEKLKAMHSRIQKIIADKANRKKEIKDNMLAEARKDELFQAIERAVGIHITDWQESEIAVAKIPKDIPPQKKSIKPSWKR